MTTHLQHGRIRLALHELQSGDPSGRVLLVLHGLGVAAPNHLPEGVTWAGRAVALDFTGHGESDAAPGGGYTAELLMADADVALAHLDGAPVAVLGFGLGAWIALLVTGARPELVHGAVLADGPGFVGGGGEPGTTDILRPPARAGRPDPFAVSELSRDLRPPDYASFFAQLALQAHQPPALVVAARQQAPWVDAVASVPGVGRASLPEAMRLLS